MSHDPDRDGETIHRALREIELAEEVGMDAVWLTEHYFSGECAYADPLVFAAAIAARTETIGIGFAVVQMALHNPVRLATQTALLDNLSRGRLTVGTGRGSAFNHYEYAGFGASMEEGADMLAEAEELLMKAWTGSDVRFEGRYWQASIPAIRPRPYQRPHPPLARACLSETSIAAMAAAGRPILIGDADNDLVEQRLRGYREAMADAGLGEEAVEWAYDRSWVSKNLCIADSYQEARETAYESYRQDMDLIRETRRLHNPPDADGQAALSSESFDDRFDRLFLVGTASQVADQVAAMRDVGVRNVMMESSFASMPFDQVRRTLTRFGEEVAPLFR